MRFIIISFLSFTLFGCLSMEPELEWEDVTSDHESTLNVFGLISADSILTSFVRVHRTLDMEAPPRFIIRDAEVIISNGMNEYIFEYTDGPWDEDQVFQEVYLYPGNDLNPQPGETWTLNVTTPGGLSVTGETIVPPLPQIFNEELPDTFHLNQTLESPGSPWLIITRL